MCIELFMFIFDKTPGLKLKSIGIIKDQCLLLRKARQFAKKSLARQTILPPALIHLLFHEIEDKRK